LLDRDGVINRRVPDGYVTSWEQFRFLPRSIDAIARLAKAGFRAIVISNQACVGKSLLTPEDLEVITARFLAEVERCGGRIEAVYYCPHREEDGCECRKPRPGLIVRAQKEHGFRFSDTYLIGDSERDLLAARNAGCSAIMIQSETALSPGQSTHLAQATVGGLYEAVEYILAQPGGEVPAARSA